MTPKTKLHVEQLEDRCVPATFGNPWPDPSHLTVSFAPDGTAIDSGTSSLTSLLGSNTSAWETQILKAFQTWAVNSNINIGVVSDSGDAFTSGGALQGDPRFGDLRIGAAPLSSGALANASPFDGYSTWSGSVVLNPNYTFSVGGANNTYDIFSVLLHEAGHTFGFPDSSDPTSAMFDDYTGLRTIPSAGDVAALQALYGGPRHLDQYAGASTPNSSMATAAAISLGGTIQGDISATNEVEWFKFFNPLSLSPLLPVSVELRTSGVSLLTAKVSVYDSAGRVVASSQSIDPLNGNLVLTLPGLSLLQTYYIRVSAARSDVFGVGTYQMRVANDTLSAVDSFLAGTLNYFEPVDVIDPLNLNGSQFLATGLASSQPTAGPQVAASYQAKLVANDDFDWYSITAPAFASVANTEAMMVSVWGVNRALLSPNISVYDANGNPLNAMVVTEDNYSAIVQLSSVTPGARYYLRVNSNSGASGDYRLAVNFPTTPLIGLPAVEGAFNGVTTTQTEYLNLPVGGYMHFALNVGGGASSDGVSMTIYDGNGNVVSSLSSYAGSARSLDRYLAAGVYKVVFKRLSTNTAPLAFQLLSLLTSDPVGITASNSSSPSNPSPDSSSNTSTSSPDSSSQTWSTSSGSYTGPSNSSSTTSYY
ncbi:MAG TPA: matrixin family metalloprotease [Gemmataceae bacterium]|jgi:hypothetical protein|nr:matrixin family metalloprotease [Gemmataceae bacterium]